MNFPNLLVTVIATLLFTIKSHAQGDKTKQLQNKLAQVTRLNTQLTEENTNLHSYMRQINQIVSNVRDSLNSESKLAKQFDFESKKWQEATFNVNKTLQANQKDLTTAQDEIRKLKYEYEILKDPTVMRTYDVSAAKVKENITAQLSDKSLGFNFDDNLSQGIIKATKQFGTDTEAWWVFDKTIDVLLELELKIVPHLYDPNRSLIYGKTNLLEKIRFSNKQYTPQEDVDKVKLYQEKALRLLETNIRKSNLK